MESSVQGHRHNSNLIIVCRTAKIDYMHFMGITPPKLKQQPEAHAHLSLAWQMHQNGKRQAALVKIWYTQICINRKKHNLPFTKESIWKKYNDIFSEIGTLPGDVYIKLKKDCNLSIIHPDQSQSNPNKLTKKISSICDVKVALCQYRTLMDQLHSSCMEVKPVLIKNHRWP